jgi:hypothetical protein
VVEELNEIDLEVSPPLRGTECQHIKDLLDLGDGPGRVKESRDLSGQEILSNEIRV